jgi:hypothetical protein
MAWEDYFDGPLGNYKVDPDGTIYERDPLGGWRLLEPELHQGDPVTIDGDPYTVDGSVYGFERGQRVRTYRLHRDRPGDYWSRLEDDLAGARRRLPDPIPAPEPLPDTLQWTTTRLDGGPHGS